MDRHLIGPIAYRDALAVRDLTEAAHGPHAMQLLVHDVIAALREAWGSAVILHRAHPVVSVTDNYERLGYPPGAAARDPRYTRYVSPDAVLRTSTSAMVPGALRAIAPAGHEDLLLVCVGLVYRRDRIDRQSVGEPHQLDLWRIARRSLGTADLREMVAHVLGALLPGHEYRTLATAHPYTEGGLEVEVRRGPRRVEAAECGLASTRLLSEAGMPDEAEGLAMGVGLDRALMLRKGIDDIRLLRSGDQRVAAQMWDLLPYRPVSAQPLMRRDLSVAVSGGTSAEELGDRVRTALGPAAESVESVEVLIRTPAESLPAPAAARIGIRPGQVNVLVRLVLRHPTRTLTAAQGNRLRDQVYAGLHEGSVHQWAAGGPRA